MNTNQAYQEIVNRCHTMALATSTGNTPNVRVINFCAKADQANILYFASDRDNQKVKEIALQPHVAFTTIPTDGIAHVRSNLATVQKSSLTISDLAPIFIAAVPGYDETIAAIGDLLDVFEIHVAEAFVIASMEEPPIVVQFN